MLISNVLKTTAGGSLQHLYAFMCPESWDPTCQQYHANNCIASHSDLSPISIAYHHAYSLSEKFWLCCVKGCPP